MNKLYLKILIFTLFALTSCGGYVSAPAIEYQNSSPKGEIIRNIQVVWNGYYLLKTSQAGRCAMLEQNFALRKKSHFFGPVHIEWENAKGKKLTKDIIFTKEDFPAYYNQGFFDPYVYNYVVFYFTQEDVEFYTSDNPRIKKIRKEKNGDWIITAGECVYDPKEVARVRALYKKYPIISTKTGRTVDED